MRATEASTSAGSDPIKKQKTKKCSAFQRDLEAEDLSNTGKSAEVRKCKKKKGKDPNFTCRDDFALCKEKKGDSCCVAGPSLSSEKHGLPSLINQCELEKNSLSRNTLNGEVGCRRKKKRKIDISSLQNSLAAYKEGIRSTEVDRKAHDVDPEADIQFVVQNGEIIEKIAPSKGKKRRKRRNTLNTNTKEKRILETVLSEQNHRARNSISMETKANSDKHFKGMDADTVMVETKSAMVKNSASSVENVKNGPANEISAGNLVAKPVLNTARRRKVGEQIDQVLKDNVEDRDDNKLDTDSVTVEFKSGAVGSSTSSLEDVNNGSDDDNFAGNSVDKPLSETTKGCPKRKKKPGELIDQVINDSVETRDVDNLDQVCLEESTKANKVASKCVSSVEENVKALSICEKGSFTDKCVLDGSLSLDLGHVSTGPSSRKLLILDLNGLLVDIVSFQPDRKPDLKVARKALYKRPFCDDFLKFCFERFNVGVWSSRTEENTRTVVDFLMEDFKHKLLFCWGQSKCTVTGFHTVEDRHKPLFLKELRKLWDKEDPDLPWTKGDYGPANTLLLDDSPYKALRNPPFTAIFPTCYTFKDENDDSLGPEGDLRIYLAEIAIADDVRHFVEQHPFGQRAITDANPSWSFYLRVIGDNKNSLLPS